MTFLIDLHITTYLTGRCSFVGSSMGIWASQEWRGTMEHSSLGILNSANIINMYKELYK